MCDSTLKHAGRGGCAPRPARRSAAKWRPVLAAMGAVIGVAAAWLAPAAPVQAQMSLPSTKGVLPTEAPKASLVLGKNLEAIRGWWAKPLNATQTAWKAGIVGRADQAASGDEPAKFADAAAASAIAKAAAFRWAMEPAGPKAAADLANAVKVLKVAAIPGSNIITRPEALTNYLMAYDFIRAAELASADRAEIEKRLLAAGRSIATGHTHSNAKGKIAGARGLAGVMLRDQALLDQALTDITNHFNYTTTDDGWFCDSQGHYLNYTLPNLAPFIRAYQQGSGVDLYPAFRPYVDMSLGMRLPSGALPGVSNGCVVPVAVHLLTHGSDRELTANALWAVVNLPPGEFESKSNVMNNDWTPTNFFALSNFNVEPKPPSKSPTFLTRGQSGVSVFRNDWSKTSNYIILHPGVDHPVSSEAALAMIPAPGAKIPAYHNHNDTGEILVASRGVYILVTPGYDRRDLKNSPKGMDPKNPQWHNLLLVDGNVGVLPGPAGTFKTPDGETMLAWGGPNLGRSIRPGDFKHTHRLDSAERGNFKGVCDFATLEMRYNDTEVRRSIAFPNEDYFVVADVARSKSSHQYTFNLMGRGGAPKVEATPKSVAARWEKDGAAAIATTVSTHALTQSGGQTWMHEYYNTFEDIFRSQATIEASNAAFLSVIESAAAGASAALTIASLSTDQVAAATVTRAGAEGWTDTLIAQPGGALATAGAMASDGQFAFARQRGGKVDSFMVTTGKQLVIAGKTVLRATQPITISVLPGDKEIRATISADGLPSAAVKVTLGIGAGAPKSVKATLEGKPVPASVGADGVTIDIAGGGSLVVEVTP